MLVFVPIWAFAAGLVPCGGQGEPACSLCHLFELAQGITKFLTFTIAPILAVLAVAWGGFNIFLAGASPDKVKTGRNAITKAAVGLLIVFGAWVAINEVLLFFSQQTSSVAEIKTTTGKLNPWTDITCSTKIAPTVKTPPTTSTATTGTWHDDNETRVALTKTISGGGYNIKVEKNNCKNIGDQNCTSVYHLGQKAIAGLQSLYYQCTQAGYWIQSCGITITGGTEYWLHGGKPMNIDMDTNPTYHKPEENVKGVTYHVVDIRSKGGALIPNGISTLIEQKGIFYTRARWETKVTEEKISSCSFLGDVWVLDGDIYVLEFPNTDNVHWHICYF